jgi:hypothetical protein
MGFEKEFFANGAHLLVDSMNRESIITQNFSRKCVAPLLQAGIWLNSKNAAGAINVGNAAVFFVP